MFCDECKKNIATVFLTKISSSEVSKVQLCEECANRMEETTEAVNLIAFLPQVLSGMQAFEEPEPGELLVDEVITCNRCGTSFNDFQRMGFLGCPACYEAFGESLAGVIEEFQEAQEHVGKVPRRLSGAAVLRRKLVELERHLERQIAEERYEAAAAVRDQIQEIKVKLDKESSGGSND